eukprot:484974-Hanusia_phi.AAC.1
MKKAESDEEVKAVSLHVLTTNQVRREERVRETEGRQEGRAWGAGKVETRSYRARGGGNGREEGGGRREQSSLTGSQIAVKFYEDNGFVRLKKIPDFYLIGQLFNLFTLPHSTSLPCFSSLLISFFLIFFLAGGRSCDAFLYAKYMHGGE